MRNFLLILLSLILLSLSSAEIDIYAKNAGDFLDYDLAGQLARGYKSYQDKDYPAAAEIFLEVLNHNILDHNTIYNLACCYGLLDQEELAALYLSRAFHAGFSDLEYIRNDPDFNSVRNGKIFKTLVDSLQTDYKTAPTPVPSFTETVGFQPYLIFTPPLNQMNTPCPLLIALHGLGDNIEFFSRRFKGLNDFIVAVPEAPYYYPDGRDPGYSWHLDSDQEGLANLSWETSSAYVAGLIEELRRQFDISAVYLLGFSQGAMLSYLTGIRYYDRIDAVAPFGGWLPEDILNEEEIAAAARLAVYIGHGSEDDTVEFYHALKAEQLLRDRNFPVKLKAFPGGHQLPGTELEEALNWFRQFNR